MKKNNSIPAVVGELASAPYNYRQIEDRSKIGLRFSMEEFGDISCIVFNIRTGHLVTGHRRIEQFDRGAPIGNFQEKKDDAGTIGYGDITVKDRTWKIRFVDWEEIKEKAANAAANNPEITGDYTQEFIPVLQEINDIVPELFDGALLFAMGDDLKAFLNNDEEEGDGGLEPVAEYDLSPTLYESYNYVVLLFKNEIDWASAADHFQLKTVANPMRPSKVGIGVVIDGSKYLNERLKKFWDKQKSKSSSQAANGQT